MVKWNKPAINVQSCNFFNVLKISKVQPSVYKSKVIVVSVVFHVFCIFPINDMIIIIKIKYIDSFKLEWFDYIVSIKC